MTGQELIDQIKDIEFLSYQIYNDEFLFTQERERISDYLDHYKAILLRQEIESWI